MLRKLTKTYKEALVLFPDEVTMEVVSTGRLLNPHPKRVILCPEVGKKKIVKAKLIKLDDERMPLWAFSETLPSSTFIPDPNFPAIAKETSSQKQQETSSQPRGLVNSETSSQPRGLVNSETSSQPRGLVNSETFSQPRGLVNSETFSQPETSSQPRGLVNSGMKY